MVVREDQRKSAEVYTGQDVFSKKSVKEEVEHYFKLAKRKVSFGTEVTALLSNKQLKNITGIKAREMMLWVEVKSMEVDDEKIRFRALAGITRSFPVDYFAYP